MRSLIVNKLIAPIANRMNGSSNIKRIINFLFLSITRRNWVVSNSNFCIMVAPVINLIFCSPANLAGKMHRPS